MQNYVNMANKKNIPTKKKEHRTRKKSTLATKDKHVGVFEIYSNPQFFSSMGYSTTPQD
jgi:predicted RNA-binding protein